MSNNQFIKRVNFKSEIDIYTVADAAGLTPKLLSAEWDETNEMGTLVTEHWPMTLNELLTDTLANGLPSAQIRALYHQTLDLLDRLHSLDILHLDLHFHNFMVRPVGDSYELAFIDFEYSYHGHVADIYRQVERWLLQMEIHKCFGDPVDDRLRALLEDKAEAALDLKAMPLHKTRDDDFIFNIFVRLRERFSQSQLKYWAVREGFT